MTREKDGSERHTRARFLVGCDGLHSRVREAVGIRFEGEAVDISFLLADATVTGDAPQDELRIYLSPHGNESLLFIAPLGKDRMRLLIALRDAEGRDELRTQGEGPDGNAPGSPSDEELQAGLDCLAPGSGMRLGEVTWRSYFHVSDGSRRATAPAGRFLPVTPPTCTLRRAARA